jgi:hypothetical protein
LRIYGDGSAGALAVTASGSLLTLAGSANLQFTNVTVDAGVTLNVPSGTLIRCTGTFTNNGTVVVGTGEVSGGQGTVPGVGVSHQPAGNSITSTVDTVVLGGASGGVGLSADEAALLLVVTPSAGGAGGGTFDGAGDRGGAGGGELVVLAQGGIANNGTGVIRADGGSAFLEGAAGGAGGIVILASHTSATNAGLISARGSNGVHASGGDNIGASGGGGGGIVHLISPSITTTGGTIDVAGGTGGASGTGSAGRRTTGAGGGACGGNGGGGGYVINAPANTLEAGGNGTAGYSFETLEDPTALFW